MRLGFAFIVLAACSTPHPSGPAWPKPSAHESDGGESLAPRPAARASAAMLEEDRAADRDGDGAPAAASPGAPASSDAAPAAAASPASTDESSGEVTGEDIEIEVED